MGGRREREQILVLVNVSFSLGAGWRKGMVSDHTGSLVAFVCCYKMREDDNQFSGQTTNCVMIFLFKAIKQAQTKLYF